MRSLFQRNSFFWKIALTETPHSCDQNPQTFQVIRGASVTKKDRQQIQQEIWQLLCSLSVYVSLLLCGEQGDEGEEELLMVLRSLYCWGTKLIPLLLGRALGLGAGTRAASPWRCDVAAGTWQEWPNVSAPRIRATGHSRNWAL